MPDSTILLLPGWQNSGPEHWQSRWERRHGYVRVEQHDWMHPLRGDWVARLQDVVLEHEQGRAPDAPARIVLVAPGDPQTEAVAAVLASWSPVVLQTLPFPSVLIGSQDDPYCRMERARHFAARWGSQFVDYGNAGHINADSGLGDWPDGHDRLLDLCRASGALTAAARPPPQ